MRYFLPLIFLFLVISSAGQSKAGNFEHRFSFGLSFSPDYTYRIYDSGPDFPGDIWDEVEDPRFGFTTGLVAKYFLTPNFAIESGLQFSDKGYKIETSGEQLVPEDGTVNGHYWINTKYHYNYLGIPLKANWFIMNRDVKVFLSGGFSTDFFLNSKAKTEYFLEGKEGSEEHSEDEVDFHKINVIGLAGFGAEYGLSESVYIRFEPIVRISFTSAATYTSAMRYWYSMGANFSVFFQK